MVYHEWGEKEVDWVGIGEAAEFIGSGLRRFGRVSVTDTKEKYGTVRVYLRFGWHQLHDIIHPGYHYSRFPKWLHSLDSKVLSQIVPLLNLVVVPLHQKLYRIFYQKAIKRWPHLRAEILSCPDFPELLKGL